MEELHLKSYAKVNLSLEILYKRQDGYHEIDSIMQEIDLCDELVFSDNKDGIRIGSNSEEIPLDSSNLVYKAWELMKEVSGIYRGITIRIDKKIPVAAGLAGGSSNGAATLKAINQLWNLKLSEEELMKIGVRIGADVPFCIMGGTARARGIGEKLTRLEPFKEKYILIANPGIRVSTAYAYSKVDLDGLRYDSRSLMEAMKRNDLNGVSAGLYNRLEKTIIAENPIIGHMKTMMKDNGALGALMSGSGSTVFGIFDDEEKMDYANRKLSENFTKVYSCKTI
ncbi:4-(cytidine 5'-diphospho)-2-C-methyl-D-erythritol kinase [Tissierella creatinini]|nr:4-(cytidine 5'-diphospho)-2-C-methyl-D-erythritol kinase [Tissierella creatinini]TJX60879.1 4-(cytidine 5'-diphospho)-2-C-methyl-D-erythritol kinase [Soehngenia saccharolytica]